MTRQYCLSCGRQRLAGEYACPACSGVHYGTRVPASAVAKPEPEGDSRLAGVLASLRLPPGSILLLSGGPGTGKTTIALQAFRAPRDTSARAPGVTVQGSGRRRNRLRQGGQAPAGTFFITSEMGVPLIQAYAKRCRVPIPEICETRTGLDTVEYDLPESPESPVILDSLTGTGDPAGALARLRAWVKDSGGRAIVTVQVTKEGDPRGPKTLEHDVEIHVSLKVKDGYQVAIVEKNRHGALGSFPYRLTEKGAEKPTWDRYYSVEGRYPDYRLEPFPSSGRWADPFRYPEKLANPLPEPPLAVAAERNLLSPSGWQPPADLEARRAFCNRAGVPFLPIGDLPNGKPDGS